MLAFSRRPFGKFVIIRDDKAKDGGVTIVPKALWDSGRMEIRREDACHQILWRQGAEAVGLLSYESSDHAAEGAVRLAEEIARDFDAGMFSHTVRALAIVGAIAGAALFAFGAYVGYQGKGGASLAAEAAMIPHVEQHAYPASVAAAPAAPQSPQQTAKQPSSPPPQAQSRPDGAGFVALPE